MDRIEDYELPESFSIECSLLADLTGEPAFIGQTKGFLSEDMFFTEKCRDIYRVIISMWEAGETIDLITIYPKVDQSFYRDHIMTRSGTTLLDTVLSHIAALRMVAQRRRLYFACIKGLQLASSPSVTEGELLEMPTKLGEEMMKDANYDTTRSIEDVIMDIGDNLGKEASKRVPTGFHGLDTLMYGGFGVGNLIVLAARPSVGKTTFMLQMAREAARKGFKALALSLEMTNEELAQRLLFSTNYVNAGEFMRGEVDVDGFNKAANEFVSKGIFLDETPQTLDEVCSTITINRQRGKCDIAFIDYLQLMSSSETSDSLYRQVTEMTKRLKKLAKRLKIPIVLLCQLNRNSVSQGRAPQLHDLRDSGSIEQDADVVLMLERVESIDPQSNPRVNMYVRKNRGGLAGDIRLELESDRSYNNFTELS